MKWAKWAKWKTLEAQIEELESALGINVSIRLILQERNLRTREMKWLSWGHIKSQQQSCDGTQIS